MAASPLVCLLLRQGRGRGWRRPGEELAPQGAAAHTHTYTVSSNGILVMGDQFIQKQQPAARQGVGAAGWCGCWWQPSEE
eukprot:1157216-Pelagomonas_calceolata.AAC.6